MGTAHNLTGVERTFRDDEIIVSKTDRTGKITYCNDVFIRLSDFPESELLGKPHSLIRHPDMPRCIFKYLWDTLSGGHEVFAYVVNRSRNGDHYWVLAHVTADYGPDGETIGYHSNRRTAPASALKIIMPLYAALKAEEERHSDRKAGLEQSFRMLNEKIAQTGMCYDQFILGL